jgi:hypothetical protein
LRVGRERIGNIKLSADFVAVVASNAGQTIDQLADDAAVALQDRPRATQFGNQITETDAKRDAAWNPSFSEIELVPIEFKPNVETVFLHHAAVGGPVAS